MLVCKKLNNGAYIKFLYHKGRKLLYRVDKDVVNGKARAGLHWVGSTKSTARYRIADPAYKGGKAVKVPNAKGGMDEELYAFRNQQQYPIPDGPVEVEVVSVEE